MKRKNKEETGKAEKSLLSTEKQEEGGNKSMKRKEKMRIEKQDDKG